MRICAAVCFALLGTGAVCASEQLRAPPVVAEGAVSIAKITPVQDDTPLADIISGEFYVSNSSEKLNCKDGLDWMTHLAKAGKAEAMFEMGELYESGNCVLANEPKAIAWFLRAAENGSAAAPAALGRLYYSGGEGIAPDYKEALRWLSLGMMQLDPLSLYYLGLMYQEGRGVRPNYKEAYKFFDMSMRLYPFFSDDRKKALFARDTMRERLMPLQVADAGAASSRLLIALLEHDDEGARDLIPPELFAVLQADNR
jgi:tetratricopeptide (TPR) repeat protein